MALKSLKDWGLPRLNQVHSPHWVAHVSPTDSDQMQSTRDTIVLPK